MRFLPTERRGWGWSFFDDFDELFTPFFYKEKPHNQLKVDISEKDNNYTLEMDLPGYDKKDISIELENGYLTIEVNRADEAEEKDEKHNYIKRERKKMKCSRTFYVGEIDESAIQPTLENGILKITFPKNEKKIKKQIDIK